MSHSDDDRPRPPRAEPEILPPEAPDAHRPGPEQVWVRQRVYIARPGPFATILGLVLLAAFIVAGAVAIVGFALLLLPAVAFAVGVFLLASLFRGSRRF